MVDVLLKILPAVVAAIVTGSLSYRFGLASTKRKEYNDLADKLFLFFDRTVTEADGHFFSVKNSDIKLLKRQMRPSHRRKFESAISALEDACSRTTTDASGQVFFSDAEEINKNLKQVAMLLNRK